MCKKKIIKLTNKLLKESNCENDEEVSNFEPEVGDSNPWCCGEEKEVEESQVDPSIKISHK